MKRQVRVHGVEAALRESHRRFGGAPVPADFRRGVMAAVRAARQRQALDLTVPETSSLWPAAGIAAGTAVIAAAFAVMYLATDDVQIRMWLGDPLGLMTLLTDLL